METFLVFVVLFGGIFVIKGIRVFLQDQRLERIRGDIEAKPERDPLLRDKQTALKWAASKGYPAPEEPWPTWVAVFGVTGLLLGVIPGVVILITMAFQSNKAKEQQRQLIMRWVDEGKPVPE